MSNSQTRRAVLDGYRLRRPPNCEHGFFRIMELCWARRPEDRPSAPDIVRELMEYKIREAHSGKLTVVSSAKPGKSKYSPCFLSLHPTPATCPSWLSHTPSRHVPRGGQHLSSPVLQGQAWMDPAEVEEPDRAPSQVASKHHGIGRQTPGRWSGRPGGHIPRLHLIGEHGRGGSWFWGNPSTKCPAFPIETFRRTVAPISIFLTLVSRATSDSTRCDLVRCRLSFKPPKPPLWSS